MIGYHDFEKINEEIEDVDAKYKIQETYAVVQSDSSITRSRQREMLCSMHSR